MVVILTKFIMKNYLKLFVLVLALTLISPVAQAQNNKYKEKNRDRDWDSSNNTVGRWVKIGTQRVQKSGERDEFRPSDRNSFTALKVRVRRNTVSFNRMTVVYENGQRQDIEIRDVIRDGGESRVINLLQRRRIDKIQFYYKTRNLIGGRAEVEVWARR
jgi:hypothetical protein